MEYQFNTIEEALEDLRAGKIILVTDDPDRENEGDMICAAEFATQENINFMAEADLLPGQEWEAVGKIRYNHKGTPCRVRRVGEDTIECHFEEPVRAVTPGQALVLYKGDYVLGGGTII